ncbi:MAG: cob(I)yrinic acid a,c-diamide adenosyltransferase [Flavobacteriales bacterium]|nr:cob(I)yrinic acid a,c-diamide adenosyltransferase [Flavobacteriales bacterium]
MKIYTRTGDKGQTGLLGGTRVSKDDARIEAYGTVDELNSHIGMLRDLVAPHHSDLLVAMQNALFSIGSRLASSGSEEAAKFQVPPVTEEQITALESAMDTMDRDLPPMRNFILPGGHVAVSQAHICRTVCRRAERRVVALSSITEVDEILIRYLNRASDLFFVLSRHLTHTLNADEIPWTPRK